MLSAAFADCTGWEERYLLEAAKDEEKIPFDSSEFDLQDKIVDALVTNGDESNVRVTRCSRLVSGLDFEPLPGATVGGKRPLETLRESLLKSEWVSTILPSPESEDNVVKLSILHEEIFFAI